VPEANLRILHGGERLEGGFEVAYTPGHASHHVSYLHEGTAFVGDVGGVRIPPSELVIPPTPPPDIDIEAWHESIKLVAAWQPERLAMTHFGSIETVREHLAALDQGLDLWAELARVHDMPAFITEVRAELERAADPDTAAAYTQAAPPDQLYAGLERYWRKRQDAAA
jgi:glyoxylase-like metal-dependent hydrolase (beta-lactamase superfamily II)